MISLLIVLYIYFHCSVIKVYINQMLYSLILTKCINNQAIHMGTLLVRLLILIYELIFFCIADNGDPRRVNSQYAFHEGHISKVLLSCPYCVFCSIARAFWCYFCSLCLSDGTSHPWGRRKQPKSFQIIIRYIQVIITSYL